MAAGIWTPLDLHRSQIRLLRLQPCKNVYDQPVCSLETVFLDDEPEFEALSYAWGDPNVTLPINFNGVQWPVTTNLESGLRHLRHGRDEKVIWVDALCINQIDDDEKTHQVQFMKLIYSNASIVRIWLGPWTEGSDEAVSVLQQLSQGKSLRQIQVHQSDLNTHHIKNIADFFNRSWWTRSWTKQEIALGQRIVLHWGTRSIETETMFQEIKWDIPHTLLEFERLGISEGTRDEFGVTFSRFAMITHIKKLCLQNSLKTVIKILNFGPIFDCSDPCDSVYAFLGLADQCITSNIIPDYTLSLGEIHIKTTKELILCTSSLIVLSLAQWHPREDRIGPTWTPSWAKPSNSEKRLAWNARIGRFERAEYFDACRSHSLSFVLELQSRAKMSGVIVGKTAKISSGNLFQTLSSIRAVRGSIGIDKVDDTAQPDYAAEEGEPCFCRILTNDMRLDAGTGKLRRCRPDDWHTYCAWVREMQQAPSSTQFQTVETRRFDRDVTRACINRRLFRKSTGLVGLGPQEMQVGDELYILAGGSVPFVLRRVPSAFSLDTFELVGDCYVYGVMDGEAVDERLATEMNLPRPDRRDVYLI